MSLVECVPNFSDGRSPDVLAAIVGAIRDVRGARVLDMSQDPDHNRCVVTFVAPPDAATRAAFEAARTARDHIDVSRHEGVHPRMGAMDVCPFVPLQGGAMEVCVESAHELGRRMGAELAIPAFFYGEAASRPERRELPQVRRGGFEFLKSRIGRDPDYAPDEGPPVLHPTAGATAVGARRILIAFNVNLDSDDVGLARAIAREIREANAGLPGIRALGLALRRRGKVQVSANVCDFERTGLVKLFDEIERRAKARGVEVESSELIGLAPAAALDASIARRVRLSGFDPARHILERAIERR